MNIRVDAARVLAEVAQHGKSLSAVLPRTLAGVARPEERALLQELCYGVLRWHPRLQALAAQLLRKPFKPRDADIECLLWVGLYQLDYMRLPTYAAVTETVEAAKRLKKPWAASLLNGVLRNYMRNRDAIAGQVDSVPESRWAHPRWLLQALQRDWPQQWQAIVEANNSRAPMTLRVNARRQTREEYLQRLHEAGIPARAVTPVESAVTLEQPVGVERLPGFACGDVSVQDAAAQLAAIVLDAGPGMRVLDACAAPGGKTAHILERQTQLGQVVALDVDGQRLERVTETLRRLALQAQVLEGDAATPQPWWDGQGFQRILLDAPCSATGVIRRHPDIKLLRRAEDIEQLGVQQARILDSMWSMLDQGGMLLYATCSVMKRENQEQIAGFLRRHADARERPLEVDWGVKVDVGRQILPGQDNMDGFYYACLEKC